ncbi:MAG: diguanylate cyclase, partial [Gammaproteobacteria bacterium]|nr:diguanylate cyclase [Gammaproteobacteria bacterium]
MADTLNRLADDDLPPAVPGERRAHRSRRRDVPGLASEPLAARPLIGAEPKPERRARSTAGDERSEADTTEITRGRIPAVAGALLEQNLPVPCLEISEGFERGKLFPIGPGLSTIGRSHSCDIRLNGHGISRTHLRIERDPYARIFVEDLGSTNGSFVNSQPLSQHRLIEGDYLQLGPDTVLLFSYMLERQLELQQEKYHNLTRDHLTGVYGRQFFDEWLRYELEASARYREPLVLMLIDIDHFKQVNDTYGHPAGDEVIKRLANTISSNLRTDDLFARIGGEE